MAVDRSGEQVKVLGIGADDDVVAAKRSFDDRSVDDVGARCFGKELTHAPRLVVVESLDLAADQETREACLAASAAPPLGHDGRRDGRYLA